MYCGNNPVSFADPSGLTVHLIYGDIGDVEWSVGIGYQYVDSYRRPFEDIRIYSSPDLRQVRFILATANEGDIIAFWGHGNAYGPIVNDRGQQVLLAQVEEASRLRYMGRQGPLRRVMVLCCDCLQNPVLINAWLAIADVVDGWQTTTDPLENGLQVFPSTFDEEVVFNSRAKEPRAPVQPRLPTNGWGNPQRCLPL